jgi:nucleoside-diphosphate-sugar epimerase
MKVLVTGATGLIGSHSALALLRAGHTVRLLVRNADTARRYFAAQSFALDDLFTADIRDTPRVKQALEGCDAVLHAAALVSLDPRQTQEIIDNNLAGTRSVIGSACEAGIRNIVYVSSLEVFAQKGVGERVTEDTRLSDSRLAYSLSKRESELYVRDLQQRGHAIQITYPAGVFGPDDPKLSESNRALGNLLKTVPLTSSGMQVVDVRDLAQAHRWLLEHPVTSGFEERRYIVGGRYYPWAELHTLLQQVTGRRIMAPRVPGAVLRAIGVLIDLVRRVVPFDSQITADSMSIATQWTPAESSRIVNTCGLVFRSGAETLSDTAAWVARAGHVKPELAGRLVQR